jgi:hypothetical protein
MRLLAARHPGAHLSRPKPIRRPKQQQTRLTPEQEAELVERYRAGTLRLELASSHRIHKTTVSDIIGWHKARRVRGLSDAEVARPVEMYGIGASLVDVGKALDATRRRSGTA